MNDAGGMMDVLEPCQCDTGYCWGTTYPDGGKSNRRCVHDDYRDIIESQTAALRELAAERDAAIQIRMSRRRGAQAMNDAGGMMDVEAHFTDVWVWIDGADDLSCSFSKPDHPAERYVKARRVSTALRELEAERDARADMAEIGESLMQALASNQEGLRGWGPLFDPAEVVVHLINQRDEAEAERDALRGEAERLQARFDARTLVVNAGHALFARLQRINVAIMGRRLESLIQPATDDEMVAWINAVDASSKASAALQEQKQ